VIFTLNLLLSTINVFLAIDHPAVGDTIKTAIEKVPILPGMVKSFPRETIKEALVFGGNFSFLVPLAMSAIVFFVFLAMDLRNKKPIPELKGTEAECARALAHEAEWVYNLRRQIPAWSIFPETTVLTALVVWPVLSICLGFLGGEDPAVLQIALSCFAMLVCVFVLFWVFAGLFWIFSQANALYYIAPSEWEFWDIFNETDDYWESVDPREYARREKVASERNEKT
jgi:hypothetical protein